MNKDFSKDKLLSMPPEKQIKILFDLGQFIESNAKDFNSSHFSKLKKYHEFLSQSTDKLIQHLNKEFIKITAIDYQFQIYLMNCERFLGQSSREYNFLVTTDDNKKDARKFPITCLLDSVRSAHNVGAIFRNSECFGVEELILSGLSPTPESEHVIKTAMNCDKYVSWSYTKNPIEHVKKLKDLGYEIWGIETCSKSIDINQAKDIPDKVALLFGHEQYGLSMELLKLSDKFISIPMYGNKNSLNVAVANAVILNSLSSKMILRLPE